MLFGVGTADVSGNVKYSVVPLTKGRERRRRSEKGITKRMRDESVGEKEKESLIGKRNIEQEKI